MRRGSFRRRLPRGRRNLLASPALLGAAVFLVLLVPALIYLFPHAPNSHSALSSSSHLADDMSSPVVETNSANASEQILRVASADASLLATVNSSLGLSRIFLENTGSSELQHVKVMIGEKELGILSRLVPGEKKVLATKGNAEKILVLATDQAGREIMGTVKYIQSTASAASSSSTEQEIQLSTLSSSTAYRAATGSSAREVATKSPEPEKNAISEVPRLILTISSNKTEGLEGDMVGYRCTAQNLGPVELSNVKIFCAGKMASTKFLPPGEELFLDGALRIEDNVQLFAGAVGEDAKGNIYTNNTSIAIWKVSSQIKLEVEAPKSVHRNENVTIHVKVENCGSGNLTDINVSDCVGEIGQIPALSSGSAQLLQKDRTIKESIHCDVRVVAHDSAGREVYASHGLDIWVLNSSLQIQAENAKVRTYPGEPAEVIWVLKNTGEEILKNVTLDGDGKKCMLRELTPGKSVRMAAIYCKNSTTWINVTARGEDVSGYAAFAEGSVHLTTLRPAISLKIMPPELEVCPGETADISALITNSGDDALTDVVLTQDGATLATIDRIDPGEFRVVNSRTVISANSTIQLEVSGKDSRGQTWSDAGCVKATVVVSALKVFVSASPPAVTLGGSANITCTVANTGSVPLYNIFVISKQFGPLGNVEYLAPKHQTMVFSLKSVEKAASDVVFAEGFTQDRKSVRGSCDLHIDLLASPQKETERLEPYRKTSQDLGTKILGANISCGNVSMAFGLPSEEETTLEFSQKIASDIDSSTVQSNNMVMDGISSLLRYVEKILGRVDDEPQSSAARELSPESREDLSASENYELSIAGVKGSEHGAISILDVSATPSQPAAGEPVKISAHITSPAGIKSASVKFGMADSPLTKQDMLEVDRVHDSPMVLESGNSMDGYWSCSIPGKDSGVYMVLSVWMTDGKSIAEGGPYMLHWSTVNTATSAAQGSNVGAIAPSAAKNGMLFIESSSVKGRGEVSIKDSFQGSAMNYNERMIGNGSISLETLRCIDRKSVDNFTEKKDLVFTGGNLKGHQTVESPRFQGGLGASVTQRFNLSHVDKSETSSVSSASPTNNTLTFRTDQAFDGTWNIQTKYAKFFKKIKADQQYTGSFQTEKTIKFQDAGQN